MNPLKTNLSKFNKDEKTSFSRSRYKEMVKEHTEKMKTMQIVTDHIEACARFAGGYKALANIVGTTEGQIREWRKGKKMKATTAMKFEAAINEVVQSYWSTKTVMPCNYFRCDRKKLIAWFFVGEVTK